MAVSVAITDAFRSKFPGAVAGVLEVSGLNNAATCGLLEQRKKVVETALRRRYRGFNRADFAAVDVMRDYASYYRSFGKTYCVLLQLESIVLKEKRFPEVSPLVDANFVSELETLVLTAAHDVAKLRPPIRMDIADAGDSIVQMNGMVKTIPAGDIVMRDDSGLCCSILYGQDNRSPVTRQTAHVLYVAYGVPGVSRTAVGAQIQGILGYLRSCCPDCVMETQALLQA